MLDHLPSKGIIVLMGLLAAILVLAMACASAEPTPAPVAPAQPAAPAAPSGVPQPTVVVVPGAPTPIPAKPTATRVLPTATPVVMGKPQSGGTLRHATIFDFDSLDGHLTRNFEMQVILFAVYNNIVQLGADGGILPDLATSWEFGSDGKTVTFSLQKGVKFHDGTDFNASVVKWNIDRVLDPDIGSAYRSVIGGAVDRVEVVDDNTVKFYLKQPSRPLLAQLSERPGHILSPTAVQRLGDDFGVQPVGTGPFKMEKWTLAGTNSMLRNDNYWEEGKPHLDKVLLQDVPDVSVQLAMVRTGESDVVTYVTPSTIEIVEDNAALDIYVIPGRTHGFRMVISQPPYDNINVRKAIGYAFDPQQIVDVYFDGRGQAAYGVVPPGSWAYNPDIKMYDRDLAKSRQLQAQAGYPNGLTIPIYCRSTASEIRRCEIFQAQLIEAGIKADLKTVVSQDYWASFRPEWTGTRSKAGMYFWSPRGDPHQSLFRVFHSLGGSNTHDYISPEYDRLLDEAVALYDTAKARLLYDKAQMVLLEDAVFIPQAFPPEYTVMTSKMHGFFQPPDLRLRLRELWMER